MESWSIFVLTHSFSMHSFSIPWIFWCFQGANEWVNGGDKEFTGVTRYGAIWTNSEEKYRLSFNKTSLKLVVNYLLNNSLPYNPYGIWPILFYGKPIFILLWNEVVSSDKKTWFYITIYVVFHCMQKKICNFNRLYGELTLTCSNINLLNIFSSWL